MNNKKSFTMARFIEIINKICNKIDIQYSQVEKVLDYFENCYAIAALQ